MTQAEECTKDSHTRIKVLVEELPGVQEVYWVVMAASAPRLPVSTFYQPSLVSSSAAKVSGFLCLPTEW